MEIWKDVVGYEGLYQVSNKGNVRSVDRYVPHKIFGKKFCKGCLIIPHITNAGYYRVNLSKGNKYTSYDIHRLVAIAFLGVSEASNLEVNHIDENKLNNDVSNLEWVTKSQNNKHGTKVQRGAKKIKHAVCQYDLNGAFIREWASATDAERAISGKVSGAISHCIKGKTKTAFGYVWRLKEAT